MLDGKIQLAYSISVFLSLFVSQFLTQGFSVSIPDERWVKIYYPSYEKIAKCGGLRNLTQKNIQGNPKEIRVWLERHYQPNHLLTLFGGGKQQLPVAEKLYDELLTLPLHTDLTFQNIDTIVSALKNSITAVDRVTQPC